MEAGNIKHETFLRLEHVEGYLELLVATVVALLDAGFYIKVGNDV